MDAARRATPNVLAIVLAGGEGRRLWPLTEDRAKPAVPIAGRYRLIDFALSNFVNSGLLKIKVLTQYKSDSLNTHIARGWRMPAFLDYYCELVPAQQRVGRDWFKGSADALHQSMNIILDENPDHTAVFGGDHMYKMDVRQMLEFHREREADVTVAVIPVPRDEAKSFGVLAVDSDGRVLEFQEKPAEPRLMPGSTDKALASMGNYIFTTPALLDELGRDALGDSAHDFGRNILPMMVERGKRVFAYDYAQNQIAGEEGEPYWRDVGTIQSYWQANMDLCAVLPAFNLYNSRWPIRTWTRPLPPAKFVFADVGEQTGMPRVGIATDSLVSEGCIVSGGRLHRCVVSPEVRINSFASVEESVLLHGVDVGRHAKIRRAILDKDVRIPPGTEIGYDLEEDKRRFVVSDGIVVVPKGYDFANPRPLRSPQG